MPVKYPGEKHVVWIDLHADLFARFADASHADRFIPVEVPGRDAVIPVHVTGLETAEQEDLAAAKKKEMDGDWKFYVHGYPSCME